MLEINVKVNVLCIFILSILLSVSGCALSPTEFHCKADAGLGCHRLDEVNAWVERGIFDEPKKGKRHVVYIKH